MSEPEQARVNDPTTRNRLDALLAEYGSLRDESLAAMGYRLQIANFTFAAFAVIIGGLAAGNVPPSTRAAVSLAALPLLSYAAAFMWLGEHHRSQRAGRAVARIETRINTLTDEKNLLDWETRLMNRGAPRRRGGHMTYPYSAAMVALFGSAFLAQVFGLGALAEWHSSTPWLRDWQAHSGKHALALAIVAVASFALDAIVIWQWLIRWDRANGPDEHM